MAYMENEETVELETTNEPVEETVETPEVTETVEETQETPTIDVAKIQETNKKLYARLKAVEAELKLAKQDKPATSPLNVEETVLLANGMPEELLKELKALSAVRKSSLIKAQTDPIFVAIKEKFEKEQRQKEASVGASRGSGAVKPKKDFKTSGLTREEHMRMVKSL